MNGAPLAKLSIHLGAVRVGELSLFPNDVTEFEFLEEYRQMTGRPVLGQAFEDDLLERHRSRMAPPPFFSNLLPEGALRDLLARRLDVFPSREFFLLARLGEDLPGAVRAIAATPLPEEPSLAPVSEVGATGQLKFSLAGVQLKLSMLREGRGLTLPSSGQGGDWIVKLPGTRHRGVPENEFVTMQWARRVGLDVAEAELVSVGDLQGLPEGFTGPGTEQALAVRRFDRPSPGLRVHIEDFAQVLGKYPQDKYGSTNFETLGRVVLRTAGDAAFDQFVQRLAFVIVSANGDAHIKNWSFIYRDPLRAELSPAYDLVSTIEFLHPDALALNLDRTKDWSRLSMAHFDAFAGRVGVDAARVRRLVTDVVRASLEVWPTMKAIGPVSDLLSARLEEHWRRLPLIEEAR